MYTYTPNLHIAIRLHWKFRRPVVLRSPILKFKITPQSTMQISMQIREKSSLDDIVNFWTNLVTIHHLWHIVVFLHYMTNMYIYKQALYTHTILQQKSKWQTADGQSAAGCSPVAGEL